MAGFNHQEIEKKAQEKWAALKLFETNLEDNAREPYYLLVEFPYPSGDLHIGHWYAFAVTDIYARYQRLKGKNVLFPIGFDAFGLPAENAAIKNGADPAAWTMANIERMRGQIRSMGASFDWSKEIVACNPSYYQWTQWLFAKLFEHDLAYRAEASVKWCPKDQTVLANEQVVDGHCERCGTEVVEKRLTQWFLKITEYADRLLKDLEPLPWREEIKEAQRAWIGRSEGARLRFDLKTDSGGRTSEPIEVFTTRPDTIYGATYVVVAPEHSLVREILSPKSEIRNKQEIEKYVNDTAKKTERERSENKDKTGVKLEGVSVINPATREEIPIYVADYVLGSYGTGAVMAVPAHDERDYEFAQKLGLPIRTVVEPLFTRTEGNDRVRADLPMVERDAISAIIRDPKTDRYLALKWKKADWVTCVTGGIEAGQTAEQAAREEILQETGYKNLTLVRTLTTVHSKFFHIPKNENRFGHFHGFYFELADDDRAEVAADELVKHEAVWLTLSELRASGLKDGFIYSLDEMLKGGAYTGDGLLANSGEFTGRDNREAMSDIIAAVGGQMTTQYRLRDWGVSRQRYWGCPIPIVYDPEGKPHAIPAEHLPWLLPTDVDFKPTGSATLTAGRPSSPLASSRELKERVERIFGPGWTPEYDTLDTFVDSSWYFARYLDPHDSQDFSDQSLMKKWLPVNRYYGGSDHTTMHLLYARFFIKALYDLALVPVSEPFGERYNRSFILGPDGQKMSKSKGNVVNPDEQVGLYGADAVRLYLAFMGPYDEAGFFKWDLSGVASMRKFLERVVRLVGKATTGEASENMRRSLAKAGLKITHDSDRSKFNTAIAALMSLLNELEALPSVPQAALREYVLMLSPFAPHLAEQLYEQLGGEGSAAVGPWPAADESLLVEAESEVIVQVAGKKRGAMMLPVTATQDEALAEALKIPAVSSALSGSAPSRVIYVPGRILNLVP